uniref:Uncharacterized protein n=1 Tax=candidate division WWE3 bacterium TaxID=2053526 RepID=A0A7C4XTG7_UNCKA
MESAAGVELRVRFLKLVLGCGTQILDLSAKGRNVEAAKKRLLLLIQKAANTKPQGGEKEILATISSWGRVVAQATVQYKPTTTGLVGGGNITKIYD